MDDPDAPVNLAQVPNEMLAVPLVAALESAGIIAKVVGGFTAGFVAEAPGTVQIVVKASDLAAAQDVLDRYHAAESTQLEDSEDSV